MGFLGGLGRMIQGEPVFETPQKTDANDQSMAPANPPLAAGPKVIPLVSIQRSEYRPSGSRMEISCHIKNQSQGEVELDKIRLLGSNRELDTYLKPGEQKELVVFQGERPDNHNLDDAFLAYKNASGDYFEAHHQVKFKLEADKTFSIESFRLIGPIKDI